MRFRVDLHIHSCLSPCADDDMTPWNIVGMAKLKGLDAVAVTDHNSAKNLPAALAAGREYGVCVLPGIEVTSREDIHLLCYFQTVEAALSMGALIEKQQPRIRNKPSLFGRQIFVDEQDTPLGEEERLLLAASGLSIGEVAEEAEKRGGVMVPAHINKGANSLLPILGMLPADVALPTVEIYRTAPENTGKKLLLTASDAHTLADIREGVQALELELPALTPEMLVKAFLLGKEG